MIRKERGKYFVTANKIGRFKELKILCNDVFHVIFPTTTTKKKKKFFLL